jgi:hypothetical protein
MLFKLSHENTGFEVLHFHGKAEQFKVGLPLALSKLTKQSMFQKIEWLGTVVKDIESTISKTSQKTYLGRLARALAYLSFCDLIPAATNWASMRWNQI